MAHFAEDAPPLYALKARTGMQRVDVRFASARWHRNMGLPRGSGAGERQQIQNRFCRIRRQEPAKNRWWLCVRSEQRAAMPLAENLLQTQTPGARRCARRQQEEGSREKGRPSRGRRSRLESLPSVHALGAPGGVPLAANRSSVAK